MFTNVHRRNRRIIGAAAVAAAIGALAAASPALAGTTGDAVTISLSGSTAMRNFTINDGITKLTPGSSITLNSGPGGTPITYSAASGSSVSVQLAAGNVTSGVTANPAPGDPAVSNANYAAIRLEWHEQGSVEGILELVDGQINDNQYNNTIYNATSGNGVFISRNQWGGTSPAVGPLPSVTPTINGYTLADNPDSFTARSANAQNRVQMALTDVTSVQGFSKAGTSSWNQVPGQPGYGKGNAALTAAANLSGTGVVGSRHQLVDESALNMTTSTIDPGTGVNYAVGPWNSAGIDNLTNKTVVITATGFNANPGTGLTRLNRTDAQWLQATGRLQNGADFNSTTRDVNSGTLNVAATNVGLDPSFAVGENDTGDGNSASGGTTQTTIGASISFSNKTAGGAQLRPTLQNARMSIGHLSISDSISSNTNAASRPLRALDYRDDGNDTSDGSNAAVILGFADPASNIFTRISATNIVSGAYVIYQNETYVTVKNPGAAFASDSAAQWAARTDADTGIKGDNSGHDVADFRQNIVNAVNNFPPSSLANPADAAVANSFILPQFMQVAKARDGLNVSGPNAAYNAGLSGAFLGSAALTSKFDVTDPALITTGSSSKYGNVTPGGGQGPIFIVASNYFFGDFNQDGTRDFRDIAAAQAAQAALQASGAGVDMFSGAANSNTSKIAGLAAPLANMPGQTGVADITSAGASKGDLVVLGDYNSDGRFDGRDLYAMARGTSLADNTGSAILSGAFADAVRNPNSVLRKNAALDSLFTGGANPATAQQKIDASASLVNDPTGDNAFNKADVDRDGFADVSDAVVVDRFNGKNYRSLDDQLAATNTVAGVVKPISLVDVELNDNGLIDASDLTVMNSRLTGTGKTHWAAGTLEKTGPGAIVFARTGGTVSVAAGAKFKISSGTFTASGSVNPFADTVTPANKVEVEVTGGQLNIDQPLVKVAKLTVGTGGNAVLNEGGSKLLVTDALVVIDTGKINIKDNDMLVTTGTLTDVRSAIVSGKIFTDSAVSPAGKETAVGYAGGGDAAVSALLAGGFDGQTITAGSVLIKYTYVGDANLDGSVDGSDVAIWAQNFSGALGADPVNPRNWDQGDWNSDGSVDGSDVAKWAQNFTGALGGGGLGGVSGTGASAGTMQARDVAPVPEPGPLGIIGLGASCLLSSRRRRQS